MNVNIKLVTTQVAFPAGTVPGGIKVTLSDGQTQTLGTGPYDFVFAAPAPGSYTAVAQAVDHLGNDLGAAVSDTFVIPQPDVLVDVPSTITVTVQ